MNLLIYHWHDKPNWSSGWKDFLLHRKGSQSASMSSAFSSLSTELSLSLKSGLLDLSHYFTIFSSEAGDLVILFNCVWSPCSCADLMEWVLNKYVLVALFLINSEINLGNSKQINIHNDSSRWWGWHVTDFIRFCPG